MKKQVIKLFEGQDLNLFLNLELEAGSFLELGKKHFCIHDDNDGDTDQCLEMSLQTDSFGNQIIVLSAPVNKGLRFRNYSGGGSSLKIHNALKVLVYALSLSDADPFLPGLKPKKQLIHRIKRYIKDILEGQVFLSGELFLNKSCCPNYFFEIMPNLDVAISVDGDTHIITRPNVKIDNLVVKNDMYWNLTPFSFYLNVCTLPVYNAMILLAIATKESCNC